MKISHALCALSLLGFQTLSIAAPTDCLKGLYLAAGASENLIHYQNKYSFAPSHQFNTSNVSPDVTIGYGRYIRNIYLALEFDANFNTSQRSYVDSTSLTNRFLLSNAYSLSGKAGFCILPCLMGYGLFGLNRTTLTRHVEFNPDGDFGTLAPLDSSKTVWGEVIGFGLDKAYTDHWHLAVEYNHVFFNSPTFTIQHETFGNVGTNKVNLSQDLVKLKVIYYL